jgi:flagellar basal-body rod modification protein FlgD
MDVSAVSGNTSSVSSNTSAVPSNTLDKNAFLKLLTTQLKYQDPLNPMDASAFTAQMAQFSSLEQLYNVNTNLENLVTSQNTLLQGLSVNMIGKTVSLQDGTSGQVTGISFDGKDTSVILDNSKTVMLTDIKKISN